MKESACPICGEVALSRVHNPAFPFCSHRCQLADLGHWLSGDYRIPGEPIITDDESGIDDTEAAASEMLDS